MSAAGIARPWSVETTRHIYLSFYLDAWYPSFIHLSNEPIHRVFAFGGTRDDPRPMPIKKIQGPNGNSIHRYRENLRISIRLSGCTTCTLCKTPLNYNGLVEGQETLFERLEIATHATATAYLLKVFCFINYMYKGRISRVLYQTPLVLSVISGIFNRLSLNSVPFFFSIETRH